MTGKARQIGLAVCLLILLPAALSARTWYIKEDGTGDAPTIQAGIDSSATGDTVVVASGTYHESNIRVLSRTGLVLTSQSGEPADVIIDAQRHDRAFVFHGCDSTVVMRGFTITNGVPAMSTPPAAGGGLLCILSYIRVADCVFTRNEAWEGGGVSCEDGAPAFVNCTFSYNNLGHGAGLHCSFTAPTLVNCVFTENTTSGFGGGIWCNYSSPHLINCTFSENRADAGGGGIYCYAFSAPVIEKTIIAYSTAGGAMVCEPEYNDPYLSCCDLFGNVGGDWVGRIEGQLGIKGNFSACPSFCNAEAGNLHLCDESPCAPGNHPDGYDCGLVGALDVGCSCGPTGSEPTTWGGIKALFR